MFGHIPYAVLALPTLTTTGADTSELNIPKGQHRSRLQQVTSLVCIPGQLLVDRVMSGAMMRLDMTGTGTIAEWLTSYCQSMTVTQ